MAGVSIQEQINTAYAPILQRSNDYGKALTSLRQLLLEYFCNPKVDYSFLTEPAKANEALFNYNQVKAGFEACLIDLKTFLRVEPGFRAQSDSPSLCLRKTLDSFVRSSQLGLGLDEHQGYYLLPARPYTPKAQVFIEQFTAALNFFRLCCAIGELYYEFDLNYQQLNLSLAMTAPEACLAQAAALKKAVEQANKDDLLELWRRVKGIKADIKGLLQKVNDWPPAFNENEKRMQQLAGILTAGAQQLQENYSRFGCDTLFWLVKDGNWQNFIKKIVKELYLDKYNSYTFKKTIEIDLPAVQKTLTDELRTFHELAVKTVPKAKLQLLNQALGLADDVTRFIRVTAASQGIDLPSSQSLFFQKRDYYVSTNNESGFLVASNLTC